jgi:hypothetical protein
MQKPALAFICVTFILWFTCIWRIVFHREDENVNNFLLGMFVMSFLAIWIDLFGAE